MVNSFAAERRAAHAQSVPVAEPVERRVLLSHTLPTLANGDFDGNGSTEILVWVNVGRHRLSNLGLAGAGVRRGSLLVLDDGGGIVGGPLAIRARGNRAPMVAAGDFNADGRTDLVVAGRRLAGANRGLTLLPGNGDGTFGTGVPIGSAPANVTSLVAGDFNGDGRADLAGTARGNRVVAAGGNLVAYPVEFNADDDGGGFRGWQVGADTDRQRDIRAIGVTAEGGGGVAGGVGHTFNPFVDHRPDPGFPSEAAVTGASGEAGGAVVGGFPSDALFLDGLPIGGNNDDDRVFLLLGNGDFSFGPTDDANGDDDGNNGNNGGVGSGDDDDDDFRWFISA